MNRGHHGSIPPPHNISGRGGYGFGLAKAKLARAVQSDCAPRPQCLLERAGASVGRHPAGEQRRWRDLPRYAFHLLFHYFGLKADHGNHGGHAHASAAGDDWEFTIGHAWNLTGEFEGGQAAAEYGYRQRPRCHLGCG